MTVDPGLLEKANRTGARLAEAERDVLLARAEYHTAIRRLHLAGAPLREIAQALSLSHQRVQQIVEAAGGSWWRLWRRRGAGPDAVCSWCERPPSEVEKLIAGPKVFICDACIAAAERALRGERHGPNGLASVDRGARCDFCRKRAASARAVVTGRRSVCVECLRTCREILDSRTS